jgi:hypothetical protein
MDQPHHHRNDPDGKWADARAARDRLAEIDRHAEQQKQLGDLQQMRAAVLQAKQETAEAIAVFGADGAAEKNPDRQRLVERLQALNASLVELDSRIATIRAPLHPHDRASHLEDLRRRTGA